ncbi:proteoglycan 4-like isoform X2 [Passer domesticus]|uniref:proteoglycan 4-like isoform X2 n=1 Tax=Passer domesticus TaxID=48849 RepID=UPI0030FE3E7B
MALALHLLLLLLLAVALPARAAQAAPLQARRADWNRDMGSQEILMNDGLKFLEDAGGKFSFCLSLVNNQAEPAGEGPTSRTEALGDAEGVSAGRTSPALGLDAWLQPSSHGMGKIQDTSDKISLEPPKQTKQELKEMRQGGQEMKGEPAEKEAFPGGSRGFVATSAAGREAMPGTGTGDEGAGKASPSAWMKKVLKPLEPPADVSTGRTSPASPAPTLDAIRKTSSHHSGTPTGKVQDTTDKVSLQPSKQIRQELKEPLQTREEMDIVLQWKVAFLEGSTPSSVPAPAAGKKAKPDTGTGTADWEAGKDSPLAWRSEVVKPSGHSAGVSAGTTSPTPTLDAAPKPSSHGRGPTTGETKDMAGKKFRDPLEIKWQMLKERLQRRQEMKGEPAEKEAFPGGSRGFVATSAAGREAMPGTGTGDEGAGKASPSAWMKKVLKPLEPPADVSTGRTSPASPAPTLDAIRKTSSHHSGTPTGKVQDTTDKVSLQPSKQIRQELKEPLQTREEMDIVLQRKVAFLEGSTPSSVPAPAAGRKAKPDTGTGTADAAGTTRPVPNAQDGLGRGFYQETGCWLAILAFMLCLELVFVLCLFGIRYLESGRENRAPRDRSWKTVAAPHTDSVSSSSSSRNGLDSPLKSSVKRTPEQPSTRKPLIAP